jgi:translation initiation factor IF-2
MPNKSKQNRIKRDPVVVVMGHIDHGKSTLLDYIRKSNVVSGEAGGITQHVGAYQAEHISSDGKKHTITFLDTPGHEAFCSIRERGAKAADIAILVVSAEDGVKPQTIEALKVIQIEKIPYLVAINKIDKPNADVNKTKQSLGENEIYVEGWGGDIPCVAISALNGTGVSELLDMVILVSELADLSYEPNKPAEGIVIESERDSRKGISATLLIKNGILKTGAFIVAGNAYAPVRYIDDFKGEKIESAEASAPVRVVGWNEVPTCGITFNIVKTKKEAERAIESYIKTESSSILVADTFPPRAINRSAPLRLAPGSVDSSIEDDSTDEKPIIVSLPLIIKTDAIGSLEGVKHEFAKIKHDKVEIKIISEGIGPINESDVKTAMSNSDIILIGFNAKPDAKASAMIERSAIPIKIMNFSIIYELTEFIRTTLLSKVPKEFIEETTGRAKILAIFSKEKDKQVVGGKVETGILYSGNEVKIMRRAAEIGRGKIRELQEKKMRVSEVAEGHEFGVMVEAKTEIAVGDRIEAVKMVEKVG